MFHKSKTSSRKRRLEPKRPYRASYDCTSLNTTSSTSESRIGRSPPNYRIESLHRIARTKIRFRETTNNVMVDLRKVTLPLRGGKAPPSSTYKQLALPAKSIVITEKPFVDKDGVEWWPETPSNTHKHAAASIAPPPPKIKPATHAPASTPHKPAGNPSQKTTADKTAVGDTRECLICVEDVERRNVLKTSCDHYWCRKCLTDRFQSATKNETQYPPKCCDKISLTEARSFLDPKVASDFQKKRVEFETTAKDRVYCYKNDCGKFIHAKHIRHNIATCSSCSRQTCTKCKTKQHSGKCEVAALEMAKQGLKAIGGKMCPKCGQALERFDGCNHFT